MRRDEEKVECTEVGRAGQGRAGQGRAEGRIGQGKAGQGSSLVRPCRNQPEMSSRAQG
jgi:hypothetical protein